MLKKLITTFGVLAAGLAFAPAASAGITIDDTLTTDKYQQSSNSPCVVGNSCSNPTGWENTVITGGGDFDVYSPTYTVSQITDITGGTTTFIVAIDVNTAGPEGAPTWGADENLVSFEMCVGGDSSGVDTDVYTNNAGWCENGIVVQGYYADGGSYDLHDYKHGNGESDSLLLGFDLLLYEQDNHCGETAEEQCVLTADTNVQFRVVYTDATNGFETFFIVGTQGEPPSVPEPGVLGLLGAGLLGLGVVGRRRRKKAA